MIKVNSSIKLNMAAIKNLSDSAERALELTAEHIHTETVQDRVVPRKDGTLQGDAFFVDISKSNAGKVTLVHNTPYASHCLKGSAFLEGIDWMRRSSCSVFAQSVFRIFPSEAFIFKA